MIVDPFKKDGLTEAKMSHSLCAILLSMESWGLRPKKFQTSVAVPPVPVQVPSQRPLARVSRQSRRLLMIRMIMK